MNAGSHGVPDAFPGGVDVLLVGAGEAADDGDVAVGVDLVADVLGDVADRLEVVWGGDGEAGFDDVHAELGEVPCDVELFLAGERGAWGRGDGGFGVGTNVSE